MESLFTAFVMILAVTIQVPVYSITVYKPLPQWVWLIVVFWEG